MTVRLASLTALVVLGSACRETGRPPGPIACALFAVAAEFGATADASTRAWAELEDIAARVRRRQADSNRDVAEDINAVLFDELGFQREIASRATRFFQLTSVLDERRGNCLGLGALYLAVDERLGASLDGVLLPTHFFVRTRGPARHNVELLRRGEAMPDDWYRGKYGPWPEEASAYFRPLMPAELVAIHWFNRGNDLREAGDLRAAESAYARAVQEFPDFAEANASLGAVQQLRGDYAAAADSYRRAARAWPDLPGLAGNLELLRRQLAGTPP
jgi:regulator of sirC expression with transglutaminase-like and TPR domain